jgi:arginine utilization regulatory protein
LVYGESGVGKELFVQSIHQDSSRSKEPFIAQNCAALPEHLLESLLFGTAKGSYTGAMERQGLFELANGGTLFLDELQSMPIDLQAKLLRVLEDGFIRRIGGTKSVQVDVRIMAAMNINPIKAVSENRLRPDLFYRLNVLSYELPPLKERTDDIPLLTEHFISIFNSKLGLSIKGIDEKAKVFFQEYHWPGNVRELKHTIEFMMNHTEKDVLNMEDLPQFLKKRSPSSSEKIIPLREAMIEMETKLITEALLQTNGNVFQASRLLQIPRQTLQYKIKKHI